MKKIVLLDFDGVIHSYTSGWKGPTIIEDSIVPGAIPFIKTLINDGNYKVCIYSSRSKQEGGIEAMSNYLYDNGMEKEEIEKIDFPTQKPAAFITIDDRAICFEGSFLYLREQIENFIPWNKRGV